MRFTINLATRSFIDQRRLDRACMVAVFVLAAFLAGNILLFSWNLVESRRLNAEISAAKKRLTRPLPQVSEKDQAEISAKVSFYNEIIKRKSYDWLAFLEKLEAATPDGISLTLLSPNREKGSLNLEGWARDFKAIEVFLQKLEDSESFYNVLLLSHRNDALWEQAKGVRFSLSCQVKEQ